MMRHMPIRRVAAGAVLALVSLLLGPGVALGHAQLDQPTPADKVTVTEPVSEVSGTFTQRVKADGSSLVVKDASGNTVAMGGRDPSNDKRMVATPATALGAGTYQVEWTTNSADDNEIARGTWMFTVAVAPTPASTPAASPAASAAPTPTTPSPTVAPAPSPSGGDGPATGSSGDVLLPIIVALIILGAGATYLLTRRNRPTDQA